MAKLDEKYNFKQIRQSRFSGVLMHITSLPGKYGIGTLGDKARQFADFLADAKQTYWQILPVGPTGYGDSPYQSFSTFAGNPYMIDLETLIADGLLDVDEIESLDEGQNPTSVDFYRMYKEKFAILKQAFTKFNLESKDFIEFCNQNAFWLDEYALFMALKDFHGSISWWKWADVYKFRNKEALDEFTSVHLDEINFYKFVQYEFFIQYYALKQYVNSKGIKIIGDLPIYVAQDSVDTWANPQLFMLDENLEAKFVGGCPPDGFSDDGQLWGNPCYDWVANEKADFKWWISRIQAQFNVFDCIRIDHFRGFESYWQIPAKDKTAKNGQWVYGPSLKLFDAIKEQMGDVEVIAEDLGYMTREVHEFREATGFPGMKILQFAFNPDAKSDYLPHNITENSVVYTGTHDNSTALGWYLSAPESEKKFAQQYLNLTQEEGYNWGLMRGAMTSIAKIAILQMQDLLDLDDSAKMNSPGTLGGNWVWRMSDQEFDTLDKVGEKLLILTHNSGRERVDTKEPLEKNTYNCKKGEV